MKALTIRPGGGRLELSDLDEPDAAEGPILVEGLLMGVCGTDSEILRGEHGEPPPGADRLVLGHESLGRVIADPTGTLAPGELVVGIVRHADPVPCAACAAGEPDMCRNGEYTEHGIKGLHGFGRQRYRLWPEYAVGVDAELESVGVLVEPMTILIKAWEQVYRIGERATFAPATALVTGAGPIGLLAAELGVRRGLRVHVLDRDADGPKPALVRALGATYHHQGIEAVGFAPDIVVECTGAPELVMDVMGRNAAGGVVCLTGVSGPGRSVTVDAGGLSRAIVLDNDVVFGSVNANRRHYQAAVQALAEAERGWLESLITRRVPLASYEDAFERRPGDVKVVIDLREE